MRYIILLFMFSLMFAEETQEDKSKKVEPGRYDLEVTTYTNKKGKVYIVETVLDTKTGKVVKRKRILHTRYKLPYKNQRGQIVRSE